MDIDRKMIFSLLKCNIPSVECRLTQIECCSNLRELDISYNLLTEFHISFNSVKHLWQLSLKKNLLKKIELEDLTILGLLDLSWNNLTYDSLMQLYPVYLVELFINNNDPLYESADEIIVRKRVVYLLPRLLILNGDYISKEEREEVDEYFNDLSEDDPDYFIVEMKNKLIESEKDKTSVESKDDVLNQPDYVTEFYHVLYSYHYKDDIDLSNVNYIISYFTKSMKFYNELIKTMTNQLDIYRTVNIFPLKPKPPVNFDLLNNITFQQKIDFIILLYCYKEFNMPSSLVSEALTVTLLQTNLNYFRNEYGLIPVTHDIVHYPTALISTIIYKLHKSCLQYIKDSKTEYNTQKVVTELDIALLDNVPVLFPFSIISLTHNNNNNNNNNIPRLGKYNHVLRYQHACCIVSRAPSCPSLTDPDKITTAKHRYYYRKLTPLIAAAGMTIADLRIVKNFDRIELSPERTYCKPWSGDDTTIYSRAPLPKPTEMNTPFTRENDPLSGYYAKGRRHPHVYEKLKLGLEFNGKIVEQWTTIGRHIPKTECYVIYKFKGCNLPPFNNNLIINLEDVIYNPAGYWMFKNLLHSDPIYESYKLHRKSPDPINNDNSMNFDIICEAQSKLSNTNNNTSSSTDNNNNNSTCQVYSLNNSYQTNFVLSSRQTVGLHNACSKALSPKPDEWSDISISCPIVNEDCKIPENEINRSVCGNLSMITPILQRTSRQDKMFKTLHLDDISQSYSASISPIKREAFKKLKKCEGMNCSRSRSRNELNKTSSSSCFDDVVKTPPPLSNQESLSHSRSECGGISSPISNCSSSIELPRYEDEPTFIKPSKSNLMRNSVRMISTAPQCLLPKKEKVNKCPILPVLTSPPVDLSYNTIKKMKENKISEKEAISLGFSINKRRNNTTWYKVNGNNSYRVDPNQPLVNLFKWKDEATKRVPTFGRDSGVCFTSTNKVEYHHGLGINEENGKFFDETDFSLSRMK